MASGPLGSTVTNATGPAFILSTNAGSPISFMLAGRGSA